MVIFSGAGISAESGIATFRDHDGLWENYNIAEVASPTAWAEHPEVVQNFYNQRRKQIIEAEPNAAHHCIAALQQQFDVHVITQNIDDLHERAGSRQVLHLHGNIRLAKSSAPGAEYSQQFFKIDGWALNIHRDFAPDGYPLRPHVVWFGEAVPAYAQAQQLIKHADIFVVIGTSLTVYPVAALVQQIPAQCLAYYIDPNAHQHPLPEQYQSIASNASQGMQTLQQLLCRRLKL